MSRRIKPTKEEDYYRHTPWKSMDEYFQLVNQYGLAGKELAQALRKKRSRIPLPVIKPPQYWETDHLKRINSQPIYKLKGRDDVE